MMNVQNLHETEAAALQRIAKESVAQAAELARLRTAIREYVEAVEWFIALPEAAYLKRNGMDSLTAAISAKNEAYATLKAIAGEKL